VASWPPSPDAPKTTEEFLAAVDENLEQAVG
jgi:hypothetical protein